MNDLTVSSWFCRLWAGSDNPATTDVIWVDTYNPGNHWVPLILDSVLHPAMPAVVKVSHHHSAL